MCVTMREKGNLLQKPPDNNKVEFGSVFTDHMLMVEWDSEQGWGIPMIKPRENLSLDPASCVLHYANEVSGGGPVCGARWCPFHTLQLQDTVPKVCSVLFLIK